MEPLIRQKADWKTATNAEVRAFFQENETRLTPTLYTPAKMVAEITARRIAKGDVVETATPVAQNQVRRFLKSIAASTDELVSSLKSVIESVGIDLSLPSSQAMIDALSVADAWNPAFSASIKELGSQTKTRWKWQSEATVPTNAEIGVVVAAMKGRVFDQKHILLSVNVGKATSLSLVTTNAASDGTEDTAAVERIVVSNGKTHGTPTAKQTKAIADILAIIETLKV